VTDLTQRERVDGLEARLLGTEARRRQAVREGDRHLHNNLANLNRETIAEIPLHDLRSLVTRWMLRLAAEGEQQP
jgi:hypothetical protein